MKDHPIFSKPLTYIILAVYITLAFPVLGLGKEAVAATIPEDHYFEYIGSISLFIASALFFYGFLTARKVLDKSWASLIKKLIFLGLALLFFFGAGEEISWGQRIFGFATPEALAEINKQDELNLHNLSAMEDSNLFTADRLFDVFWFLFGVFIPVAALLSPAFKRLAGRFVPIVHWGMSALFMYNYLWAKLAKTLFKATYTFDRISLAQAIQEIKESNYAVIFILVAGFAAWELSQSRAARNLSVENTTASPKPVFHN